MNISKKYSIILILAILSMMIVGCGNKSSSEEGDLYIEEIKKWSDDNLIEADNYTLVSNSINLWLDEEGNELVRNDTQSEIIIHYDPYKTKTTTLSETEHPTQPNYELHQNGEILSYSYDYSEENSSGGNYWFNKTTNEDYEDYPDQSFFERTYIDEGERMLGLFVGIIDYEIIEEDDEQVVIKAIVNPTEVYFTYQTQTITFNNKNHQVVKVEDHLIQNMEEIAPHLEVDGKSVKEFDITFITEYKDINSSPDFDLPEAKELKDTLE